MINGSVSVSSSGNGLSGIMESLKNLSKIDVLVGILEEESSREGGKVTNAELAFIHSNGSPLNNIPARPFIEPAIEDPENAEMIAVELRKAVESALAGKLDAMSKALVKAGKQGQNAARDWFTNPKNGWAPNSPYTVLQKIKKKRDSTSRAIVRYVAEGGSLSNITGLEGMTQVLIDTDQLRKAVTFVVREKD